MRLFDLHCDTLYKVFTEKKSLASNDCHISLEKGEMFDKWIQCCAVWIPDEIRGEEAVRLVENCSKYLSLELSKPNVNTTKIENVRDSKKSNIILTLEGGACLGGKIENIKYFRNLGARAMTLTWNGSCEIGDGADVENSKGLTQFGKEAIKEMEKCGIAVDLSHASDRLFYDVIQNAKRPVIATHSNSRTVFPHRRNLTDEQFEIIKQSGGIVGLNFHKYFLSDDSQSIDDLIKHTEHFLSLGGENTVAIGSDFDGADMPDDIKDITDMGKIYEKFLKLNYSETLADNIFFNNAFNFYQNFDN